MQWSIAVSFFYFCLFSDIIIAQPALFIQLVIQQYGPALLKKIKRIFRILICVTGFDGMFIQTPAIRSPEKF